MSVTIAFNTANLVAQYSGYKFKLSGWGEQHKQVVENTGIDEFAEILRKIRAAGYDSAEIWIAHVEKCADDEARAAQFAKIIQSSGIKPVALAGTLNDSTARICRRLGLPCACGGYWGSDKPTVIRVMRETGILYNYENHPEKTIDAIRSQIDGGENGLAIALDTGWLGTQGIDAPKAVWQLGRLIRHVHVKDVKEAGEHETVPLGTGVVDIAGVLRKLKAIGYTGVLSWEDEPKNRNPFDIAAESRQYILKHWGKA